MDYSEQKIGFKQFSETFYDWLDYLYIEEEFVAQNESFIAQFLSDAYISYCSRENFSISQLAIDFSIMVRNFPLAPTCVCTHTPTCMCVMCVNARTHAS